MNALPAGVIGFFPASVRRWLTTSPHALAAGDHTTGRGPFVLGSGQSSVSSDAPSPDAFFATRTVLHSSSTLARSEPLKRFASAVRRSTFSGDTSMSTTMHFVLAAAGAACMYTLSQR